MPITAVILAAGEGTRMKSHHPKVAHTLLGLPLVLWSVRAVQKAGVRCIVVVVGNGSDEIRSLLAHEQGVKCVQQSERKGTGHAVKIALEQAQIREGTVLVLPGDSPLLRPETLRALIEGASSGAQETVLTMVPPDASGYGRVIFGDNGCVQAIVEDRDCTTEQRKSLHECNSSVYAFDAAALRAHIGELDCDNVQHEYYLTDMVSIFLRHGLAVSSVHCDDYAELLGVNSRKQLAEASRIMQRRINEKLMSEGVTMLDPGLVWVGPDVSVGCDTTLLPLTMLWGDTHIGEGCMIGPNTRLTDTRIGNGCTVDETVAIKAVLENDVNCGPRAYLRPGAHLLDGSKAGTHVEIKNSTIGKGSKVPHLSYIGDTTMGSGVNIGAGSITCNYDGVHKNKTVIGDDVFIGSDTMMVAPVTIGDGAIVGASSCITRDVPADALALERSKEKIVEGYASARMTRLKKGE